MLVHVTCFNNDCLAEQECSCGDCGNSGTSGSQQHQTCHTTEITVLIICECSWFCCGFCLDTQLSDWFCRGFCLPNYQIGSDMVFVCPTIRLVQSWFWFAQLQYKNLKKTCPSDKKQENKKMSNEVQCIQYIHLACQGELTSEASF